MPPQLTYRTVHAESMDNRMYLRQVCISKRVERGGCLRCRQSRTPELAGLTQPQLREEKVVMGSRLYWFSANILNLKVLRLALVCGDMRFEFLAGAFQHLARFLSLAICCIKLARRQRGVQENNGDAIRSHGIVITLKA
jgi:hypothetical protein